MKLLSILLLLFFLASAPVLRAADEDPVKSPLYSDTIPSWKGPSFDCISRGIVYFIAFIGAMTCLLYVYRKRKMSVYGGSRGGKLRICETRMLGNKQFLVVVEYGKQKMLLGVGPGMIHHLCCLPETDDDSK